jgi:hypothetical protein
MISNGIYGAESTLANKKAITPLGVIAFAHAGNKRAIRTRDGSDCSTQTELQ